MWHADTPLWIALAHNVQESALASVRGIAPPLERSSIPDVAHQIWLGGQCPSRLTRILRTWKSSFCWGDTEFAKVRPSLLAADVERHGRLEKASLLDTLTNYGEISDVLRYELLYAVGGMYNDVDEQMLGDFTGLRRSTSFFAGISGTSVFELNNAVLGCAPRHPLMLLVLATLHDSEAPASPATSTTPRTFQDTIARTGPGLLTTCVFRALSTAHATGQPLEQVVAGMVQPQVAQRINEAADKLRDEVLNIMGDPWRAVLHHSLSHPPPTWPAHHVAILPKWVLYPIPNTAQVDPPEWTHPSERGEAAFMEVYGEVEAWGRTPPDAEPCLSSPLPVPACLSDLDWKRRVVPAAAAKHIQQDTLAVHYWARTWQRKQAQLTTPTVGPAPSTNADEPGKPAHASS